MLLNANTHPWSAGPVPAQTSSVLTSSAEPLWGDTHVHTHTQPSIVPWSLTLTSPPELNVHGGTIVSNSPVAGSPAGRAAGKYLLPGSVPLGGERAQGR